MLYNHFTEKLIGLQGLKVTNIENEEKTITIYAEMERKAMSEWIANAEDCSIPQFEKCAKRYFFQSCVSLRKGVE